MNSVTLLFESSMCAATERAGGNHDCQRFKDLDPCVAKYCASKAARHADISKQTRLDITCELCKLIAQSLAHNGESDSIKQCKFYGGIYASQWPVVWCCKSGAGPAPEQSKQTLITIFLSAKASCASFVCADLVYSSLNPLIFFLTTVTLFLTTAHLALSWVRSRASHPA